MGVCVYGWDELTGAISYDNKHEGNWGEGKPLAGEGVWTPEPNLSKMNTTQGQDLMRVKSGPVRYQLLLGPPSEGSHEGNYEKG